MEPETAGDPISGMRWSHKTPRKAAEELESEGIEVSVNTVSRLLKELGYHLRVNHKKVSHCSAPDRDAQFRYIAELREDFSASDLPVISIDAKKRELVGNFKNAGVSWSPEAVCVNDHDFRSLASGVAIPYGIYDTQSNSGSVFVGTTFNTAEFAVKSITSWWRHTGRIRYPEADHLLILADGGGSNAANSRAWKYFLQRRFCDKYNVNVTVCHYPAGTSKWNPIEHRLFSEISKNWAGQPLTSYETVINFISTTKTNTGLEVKAYLDTKEYNKGIKVSNKEMDELILTKHSLFPKLNYTLEPRTNGK